MISNTCPSHDENHRIYGCVLKIISPEYSTHGMTMRRWIVPLVGNANACTTMCTSSSGSYMGCGTHVYPRKEATIVWDFPEGTFRLYESRCVLKTISSPELQPTIEHEVHISEGLFLGNLTLADVHCVCRLLVKSGTHVCYTRRGTARTAAGHGRRRLCAHGSYFGDLQQRSHVTHRYATNTEPAGLTIQYQY